MLPAIVQDGTDAGSTRFVMSLRATGEGHISSAVFRRGVIDRDNRITIQPVSQHSRRLQVVENREFEKPTYQKRLIEIGATGTFTDEVMNLLGESFNFVELKLAIDAVWESHEYALSFGQTADQIIALARANYDLHLPDLQDVSEFVIFPNSDAESHGIEDMRLVQFRSDDGGICYYGVYTAYDGSNIMPQILETTGFHTAKIRTLGGRYALNKGMALFPRKVDGRYLMLGRLDNENLFLLRSDDVLYWNEAELLLKQKFAWEIIQIGNFKTQSRSYVGRFNFRGSDQQKRVKDLSGGERNRVHLAKLLRKGGNLLLLDEPTNDLDVETLRALEEALLNFPGSALVISHDRWFLDRVASHILAFEDDGEVVYFEGNFNEYDEDFKKRKGDSAMQPKRMKYKKLA